MPKKSDDENLVVSAAKAIGKAAGKVAALAGTGSDAPTAASHETESQAPKQPRNIPKPKLVKKDKQHLPRRVKKAEKKARVAS